jgi:hypothetical protein
MMEPPRSNLAQFNLLGTDQWQQTLQSMYACPTEPVQEIIETTPPPPPPKESPMRIITALCLYALIGFSTFSWLYNHQLADMTHDREPVAFLGGVLWPVYWTGKLVFATDGAITGALNAPKLTCQDDHGNTWGPVNGVCQFHSELSGGSNGTGNTGTYNLAPLSRCIQVGSNTYCQ